jgi:hypothetical protein
MLRIYLYHTRPTSAVHSTLNRDLFQHRTAPGRLLLATSAYDQSIALLPAFHDRYRILIRRGHGV